MTIEGPGCGPSQRVSDCTLHFQLVLRHQPPKRCVATLLLKLLQGSTFSARRRPPAPQIEADKNVTNITSWPCPEAVSGTDAAQFPPGLTAGSTARVWIGDAFRSALLHEQGPVGLHGVELLRFQVGAELLAANPCFDQEIYGLFNISGPRAAGATGVPGMPGPQLLVSFPHYCHADPR
jgi:hypothetical protein